MRVGSVVCTWMALWVFGCRPGVDAHLRVNLQVEPGVTPPVGTAELTRRETTGDLDEDGAVLIPGVSAEDYGELRYGEELRIGVPEGWVVLDVLGFEEGGSCAELDVKYGPCVVAQWEGMAMVWVGEGTAPENYSPSDLDLPLGGEARLDIVVRESCECPG